MPRAVEKMRDLGTPELEARERELAEQIFRLRFQLTTGQAEAVTRLRSARKIGPACRRCFGNGN